MFNDQHSCFYFILKITQKSVIYVAEEPEHTASYANQKLLITWTAHTVHAYVTFMKKSANA